VGSIYRRKEWYCKTDGGKRLARTADREACQAAGHDIEERESSIYWVKYRRSGRTYAESSESTRIGDARRMLRRIEGDIERGKFHSPKANRLTFEDAAKDLIADYTTNGKRSADCAERRIRKHLTPFFGGRRMSEITTTAVRAFIVQRQTVPSVLVRKAYTVEEPDGSTKEMPEERRAASNAEINRELATLKRMFSLGMQSGQLQQRPYIPMLKENNIRTGFFEGEQLQSVLPKLPTHVRPVIEFAYITGWRIASEVLKLEWRQVDFKAGEVRLDAGTTKNDEARTFPLTPDLRRVLKAQFAERERFKKAGHIVPYVFFREAKSWERDQNPKPIRNFKKVWQTACLAAGSPGRIPHDLRRTAVRNLVRAGVPERVAMQLTGHKTRSVFERYNIVSETDKREAARRLGEYSASQRPKKRRVTI
jgi:integrase